MIKCTQAINAEHNVGVYDNSATKELHKGQCNKQSRDDYSDRLISHVMWLRPLVAGGAETADDGYWRPAGRRRGTCILALSPIYAESSRTFIQEKGLKATSLFIFACRLHACLYSKNKIKNVARRKY